MGWDSPLISRAYKWLECYFLIIIIENNPNKFVKSSHVMSYLIMCCTTNTEVNLIILGKLSKAIFSDEDEKGIHVFCKQERSRVSPSPTLFGWGKN